MTGAASGAPRVAALYDIHGNRRALEAVLAELHSVRPNALVIGGDVVWGPAPRETLELLETLRVPVHWIRGNADREVGAGGPIADALRAQRDWVAERLGPERRARLASLPTSLALDVAGLGSVRFCHGSPRSDDEIVTRATPPARLEPMLAGVSEYVVVLGHTHVQFDRVVAGRRVVNAGSVGLPCEACPGAYWALLGPDVDLRRTDYDVQAAAREIEAGPFPGARELVAHLLDPPEPERATGFFEERGARQG